MSRSSTVPPRSLQQLRVERLVDFEAGDVVGDEALEEVERAGAFEVELAHVADIEEASALADGAMLVEDAGVLDGHLPAAELDEPRAEGDVPVVEGGAFEGCRAAVLRHAGRSSCEAGAGVAIIVASAAGVCLAASEGLRRGVSARRLLGRVKSACRAATTKPPSSADGASPWRAGRAGAVEPLFASISR